MKIVASRDKKGEKAPLRERHRLLSVKERGERRTKSRKGGQVSTWYLIPFENVVNTHEREGYTYVRTRWQYTRLTCTGYRERSLKMVYSARRSEHPLPHLA